MAYFRGVGGPVRAVPGAGLQVPIWILGSSMFGAQLAAALGLPFAFASHFAPAQMMQAIEIYRAQFRPSAQLDRPYVMLGFNVFAADTDEEARLLFTSLQQAFVNLRRGRPGRLPPPSRRLRGAAVAGRTRDDRAGAVVLRGRVARDRPPRPRRVHQPHRRRRADRHLADLRPRRAGSRSFSTRNSRRRSRGSTRLREDLPAVVRPSAAAPGAAVGGTRQSPGSQCLRIAPACRAIARHRAICRASSGPRRPM